MLFSKFVICGFLLIAFVVKSTQAWFENCDHVVPLNANSSIYINSPYYPNKWPAASSCRYTIQAPSDYVINIQCNIDIAAANSACSTEFFYISSQGSSNLANSQYYCGQGYIQNVSSFNILTIAYTSSARQGSSSGGTFSCLASTSPQPCDCGWTVSTKIVNGVEAKVNEFPLYAGMVYMPLQEIFCGATIISHLYAVTAAHCFSGSYTNPTQISVIVGEHDLRTGAESPYTRMHAIDSYRRHESFDANNNYNDIALVKVKQDIQWTRGVGPACLPIYFSYSTFAGQPVTIAGWGTKSFSGPASSVLMKANVAVISNSECTSRNIQGLIGTQMCTLDASRDSCQRDSGGPLIFSYGRLYIAGIISAGTGCGAGSPAINTRMTSYLDWIYRNTPGTSYCAK